MQQLREYRKGGCFPKNRAVLSPRLPTFVDETGVPCAMAHLLNVTGASKFVKRVTRTNNHAYVRELASDPDLRAWLEAFGMTLPEAARVQPEYKPTYQSLTSFFCRENYTVMRLTKQKEARVRRVDRLMQQPQASVTYNVYRVDALGRDLPPLQVGDIISVRAAGYRQGAEAPGVSKLFFLNLDRMQVVHQRDAWAREYEYVVEDIPTEHVLDFVEAVPHIDAEHVGCLSLPATMALPNQDAFSLLTAADCTEQLLQRDPRWATIVKLEFAEDSACDTAGDLLSRRTELGLTGGQGGAGDCGYAPWQTLATPGSTSLVLVAVVGLALRRSTKVRTRKKAHGSP